MALSDALPVALPPEWEARYRAAWPSSDLLAETVPFAAAHRIAMLGGAADPLALIAALRAPSAECIVADDDAAAGAMLGVLAGRAGLPHLRSIDPEALTMAQVGGNITPCDLALSNTLYHPNKHVTLALINIGHTLLAPGARLYVAGAKNRGIRSIQDQIERIFGNVATLAMRKGHRVVSAVRMPSSAAPETLPEGNGTATIETVVVRGQVFHMALAPAVFAGGRLDPAAALLATSMEVRPADVVADLGCGSGIVGLVAARLTLEGHVYLLDSSFAAVRLAAANAQRNAIANVTALAGDALAPLRQRGLRPSVIVTNPPFHSGQVEVQLTAERFFAESAERLDPGGRCYVVANRFLPYEAGLRRHFGLVREVTGDVRYKVLLAEDPLPAA